MQDIRKSGSVLLRPDGHKTASEEAAREPLQEDGL